MVENNDSRQQAASCPQEEKPESSHLKSQAESKESKLRKASSVETSKHPQWHTSFSRATPPKLSQTVSPIGD